MEPTQPGAPSSEKKEVDSRAVFENTVGGIEGIERSARVENNIRESLNETEKKLIEKVFSVEEIHNNKMVGSIFDDVRNKVVKVYIEGNSLHQNMFDDKECNLEGSIDIDGEKTQLSREEARRIVDKYYSVMAKLARGYSKVVEEGLENPNREKLAGIV